jgi:hypothetical protein
MFQMKRKEMSISTSVQEHSVCVIAYRILCRHQQQVSINVWAGIAGECLVGLHVLPHQLTGSRCRDFLLHRLQTLLEDVPQAVRAGMWYMQDCALAHFSPAVRDVLNNTCHDRWIGRGGPTAWPPCSMPTLNPLDFYLCGYLRALVYAAPVDNEEALNHRIVDACQTIPEQMRRSIMRHVEVCIESHEGHFGHLL